MYFTAFKIACWNVLYRHSNWSWVLFGSGDGSITVPPLIIETQAGDVSAYILGIISYYGARQVHMMSDFRGSVFAGIRRLGGQCRRSSVSRLQVVQHRQRQ